MICIEPAEPVLGLKQFALVSYIPDPLGGFLDRLRLELVPSCSPHAHVTVLPPRPIATDPVFAARELSSFARSFEAFDVELGEVEVFPVSQVIYVGVRRGEKQLREMYHALNRGSVAYREQFPYHPHITLAQNFEIRDVERLVKIATQRWAEYCETRSFHVQHLDFVKNIYGSHWTDLASIELL